MSVRRLAEIALQPSSFAFNEAFSAQAETWIAKFPEGRQQSAVIPLLMLAQEQEGWVTKAAIEGIADMLRMPRIRALEVATFYTQFQLKPVGSRAHVQVCGTTPCMLRGSEALMEICREKIHHDQFHLNENGTLSWEEVECLGACVNAPMVMIYKDAYEDLTPERLAEIIDAFEAGDGAGVPTGPQSGRAVSVPASGQTTLLDEQVFIDATKKRDAAAARTGGQSAAGNVDMPPSEAAKPATDAPETNPAIKSPSPVKVDPATEGAKESEAPAHDAKAADRAEPAAQGEDAARHRPIRASGEPAPHKAPELAAKPQAGESGKSTETVGTSVSPTGASPNPAEAPAGVSGAESASPSIPDAPVPMAGVDALGSSMGGEAAPKGDASAVPIATAAHAGGSNVVDVSESNAPRPGDDQMAAKGAAAQGNFGVSLNDPDRPSGIAAPERPDDLKLMSGIGPKIEGTLHGLGIYTFAQIAGWSERERRWVDAYLRFHGRIERDNWTAQAQALATGGEEEYFRVFGKKPR